MEFLKYLEAYENSFVGEPLTEKKAAKKPSWIKKAKSTAKKSSISKNPAVKQKFNNPPSEMSNPRQEGKAKATTTGLFTNPPSVMGGGVKSGMTGQKNPSPGAKFSNPPSVMGGGIKAKTSMGGHFKSPAAVMGMGIKSGMGGQKNSNPGAKFKSPQSVMGGGTSVKTNTGGTFKSPASEMKSPYQMKGVPTIGKTIREHATSILNSMEDGTPVHLIEGMISSPQPVTESMKDAVNKVASRAASLL